MADYGFSRRLDRSLRWLAPLVVASIASAAVLGLAALLVLTLGAPRSGVTVKEASRIEMDRLDACLDAGGRGR